jgi:ABC-type phosphate transport system permease subunit
MATLTAETMDLAPPPRAPRKRTREGRGAASLLAHGEPMIWLTGGALEICLLMIVALLVHVANQAVRTFWPTPLVQTRTVDGRLLLGEETRKEWYAPSETVIGALPADAQDAARNLLDRQRGQSLRKLYRTGNYELTNEHYTWVSDFEAVEETTPEWAIVVERLEWGRFYGTPARFLLNGKEIAVGPEAAWQKFTEHHGASRDRWRQRRKLEQHDIGEVNAREEAARLAVVEARLDFGAGSPEVRQAEGAFREVKAWADAEYARIRAEIEALAAENRKYQLVFSVWLFSDHQAKKVEHTLQVSDIVRAYPANQLSLADKWGVYLARWWEFLADDPREANSEGGVLPAIWGTVVMTLIMSLAVVPCGVLAALYLREYAKAGPIVSAVRIAINNLAGVPSIVFGVFGLGFFCYIIGAYVDGGPKKIGVSPWPAPLWFAALGTLAACATGGFFLGLYNLSGRKAEGTVQKRVVGYASVALWIVAAALLAALLLYTPHFEGFYRAKLFDNNNPTYGKGALIWSSLTLALLTLPVVIVATEEALAAVPNSMREGSYACGAGQWQTIRRIVLPRAMPGIMTGMILAMARGAGEVAPLMLVGAVKLAPELPVDLSLPFVHPDRSFMHLGFHIYDLGFQSQNSEAAAPMVYTTTLLLILIIALLNIAAVWLRGRLRRKFLAGQF